MTDDEPISCRVCQGRTEEFGEALVLRKYSARFQRCLRCGTIQASNPTWLQEAYATAITATDIGSVGRNLYASAVTKVCIALLFDRRGPFVDYGGGYGLFVRLMRDKGFDFRLYDKYCENIFAKGFAADLGARAELLTAFEVFEHLAEPAEDLEKMLRFSGNILFSTVLLPTPAPALDQWWYYGLHHGQHVVFYTVAGLRQLATRYNLHFCSNGSDIHLFTRHRVSPLLVRLITNSWAVKVLNALLRYPSLLPEDYAISLRTATAGSCGNTSPAPAVHSPRD